MLLQRCTNFRCDKTSDMETGEGAVTDSLTMPHPTQCHSVGNFGGGVDSQFIQLIVT